MDGKKEVKKKSVKNSKTSVEPNTKKLDTKKKTSSKGSSKGKSETKKTEIKKAVNKTSEKKVASKKATKSSEKAEAKKTSKSSVKKEVVKSNPIVETKIEDNVLESQEIDNHDNYTFCTKCGKKLDINEKCNCELKQDFNINIDKDAIINKSKNIFDIILGVYKKPYEFSKEFTKNGDYKNSFILLAIIAISMGLLITALTFATFHVQIVANQFASIDYNIPYFKVFIIWTIVSFIMSFIPIFITFVATNLFSNAKFDFDNSLNLYAATLSSVILINFVSAIFIFTGLFIKFFLLISILAGIFAFVNYIFIFRDMALFEKDKESFIFLGIALVWIIGLILICSIFASGINGLDISDTIASAMNK